MLVGLWFRLGWYCCKIETDWGLGRTFIGWGFLWTIYGDGLLWALTISGEGIALDILLLLFS